MMGDTHTEARLADEIAALSRRVSKLEGSAVHREESDGALSAGEEAAQRLARAALHGWPDRHHAEQGVEVAAGGAL